MKTLAEIYVEISNLKHKAIKAMIREFPVGSKIEYSHGNKIRKCIVIAHNPYHDRMLIEGVSSKRYWIDARKCIRKIG